MAVKTTVALYKSLKAYSDSSIPQVGSLPLKRAEHWKAVPTLLQLSSLPLSHGKAHSPGQKVSPRPLFHHPQLPPEALRFISTFPPH